MSLVLRGAAWQSRRQCVPQRASGSLLSWARQEGRDSGAAQGASRPDTLLQPILFLRRRTGVVTNVYVENTDVVKVISALPKGIPRTSRTRIQRAGILGCCAHAIRGSRIQRCSVSRRENLPPQRLLQPHRPAVGYDSNFLRLYFRDGRRRAWWVDHVAFESRGDLDVGREAAAGFPGVFLRSRLDGANRERGLRWSTAARAA